MSKFIKEDADEAMKLVNNTFFQKHVWGALRKIVDDRMLQCNARDKELASDIIRCRQIMEEFELIIKSAIDSGRALEAKELKILKKKTKLEAVTSAVFDRNKGLA